MNRDEVVEAVKAALAEVLQRAMPDVGEETRLFEDLHLDSTSVLEMLMALEDLVGLTVDPEDLQANDFRTVGSLADYVLAQLSAQVRG